MKKEKQPKGSHPSEHEADSHKDKKSAEGHKGHDNKTDYEKLKVEFDNLKELLQRLQADHENFRKRVEKNQVAMIKNSNKKLILELLPVIDHLELALSKADENDSFAQGMKLIHNQFLQVLENFGVTIIDTQDCQFDPHQHEAICMEEGDCDPNTIIGEMQKGYKLQDMILRPAKVRISKKRQENNGSEKTE